MDGRCKSNHKRIILTLIVYGWLLHIGTYLIVIILVQIRCTKEPGWLCLAKTPSGGFVQQKKFEVYEMNLTGFNVPQNPLCDDCNGRWALDPSNESYIAKLSDNVYDVDNDSLMNSAEAPDKWNTNPVDRDSDGDLLFDGWEVRYSSMP